jgi:hypothetical protein
MHPILPQHSHAFGFSLVGSGNPAYRLAILARASGLFFAHRFADSLFLAALALEYAL